MLSSFYNDFDTECQNHGQTRKEKGRTPFEQDRDRIIYSPAFRRLQNKTQVFLSGEFDFYRTRLTHSIEVSQIGRSICNHLNRQDDGPLGDDFIVDQSLVEAVCLAHDIGHPSFGHAGEAVLNELMYKREAGGFEGNAQNLRILDDLFYRSGAEWKGMNPTRGFLDGMLKYKTLHADSKEKENHFVYDFQQGTLNFVSGQPSFREALKGDEGSLNSFKSIECRIMDWADDIAYSIHDVSDGIQAGFVTVKTIRNWQEAKTEDYTGEDDVHLDRLCEAVMKDRHNGYLNGMIGKFIHGTTVVERRNFLSDRTNRYAYDIKVDPAMRKLCKLMKKLSMALVFRTPQIHQTEYKGRRILKKLFEVFEKEYVLLEKPRYQLLPAHYGRAIAAAADDKWKYRIICDYISGMTDGFVVRTYRRLFDPQFGSITDLV